MSSVSTGTVDLNCGILSGRSKVTLHTTVARQTVITGLRVVLCCFTAVQQEQDKRSFCYSEWVCFNKNAQYLL